MDYHQQNLRMYERYPKKEEALHDAMALNWMGWKEKVILGWVRVVFRTAKMSGIVGYHSANG